MKVPFCKSDSACRISSRVFMTIGPYHATGSPSGFPRPAGTGCPRSPACTVTSSPRSNRTSERLPTQIEHRRFVDLAGGVGEHAARRDASRNVPAPCEHVRERVPRGFDGQRLAPAGRHRDVEIHRIGRDAVHRPALAPEICRTRPSRACRRRRRSRGCRAPSLPDSAAPSSSSEAGRLAHSWKPCMRPPRRPAASPGAGCRGRPSSIARRRHRAVPWLPRLSP